MITKSLNDCLTLTIDRRGVTPKKLSSDWSKSGYRVLSANNVKTSGLKSLEDIRFVDKETYQKWMKEEIQRGDILLTSEAPAGEVFYWDSDEKIVVGQRLFGLRTKNNVDSLYLKYFLQSQTGQSEIRNKCSGSTVFGISAKMFDQIKVSLPESIEIQKKASSFLYAIDKKIDNNNKINAELESLAKTIYDYWFLQFEFPNEEGNPYKSSGGKMVWNEELKREIPEGWEVFYLKNLFSFVKGKNPSNLSQSKTENCNSPYITIDVANLGEPSFCNPQDMIMCHEDVIMVMDGAASGDIYIGCKGVLGSTFSLLKIKNDIVKKEELYMTLLSLKSVYKKCNKGSTVPHANKEFIEQIAVPFPQKRVFDSKLEQIFKRIFKLRYENQKLSSLRDFLLPMLMNGQITFNET